MRLLKNRKGAPLIEYALLVALIAVVVMAVLGPLGQTVKGKFTEVNSALAPAQ